MKSPLGPRLRLAVGVVAVSAVLAGCTTSPEPDDTVEGDQTPSASPAAPSETPEPEPAPETGACYRMSVSDASAPSNESKSVPCKKRHTARTLYVGSVGDLTKADDPAVDSPAVERKLAKTCPAKLADFLGGSQVDRNLSRFVVVWFTPTLEQADAGADWFRCDVLAFGNADRLLRLPADERLKGILDRPGALDTFGLCGTAAPSAADFERVACALKHSWRAISTIRIADGARYPGVEKARQSGDEECADQVADRAGFTLEIDYGWEWPTKAQWKAGQRFGFCWAPA